MKKQLIKEAQRMMHLAGIITENERDEIETAWDTSPNTINWNVIETKYKESGLTGEEFFGGYEEEFRSQFEGKPVDKQAYFDFYMNKPDAGGQDDRYNMVNWIGFTDLDLADKLYNTI
jgi:hypothetical protein